MAFAEGFERGGRMAQGIIGTYRDANQRARERAAEEEIAALNEQYARSGEMIESPQALGPITRPQVYAAPDVVPTGVTRTNMQTGAQAPVAAPRATTTPFRGQTLGGAPTTPVAQPRIPTAGLVPSTPPAQSQIYQQQADVYSRYGLTDQARRTRDLGLGAARDEERMATEKERYETGLRVDEERYQTGLEFDRSREEREQNREDRSVAEQDYINARRTATDKAIAAYAADGDLDAAMANPSVDQMALFQFVETRGSVRERERARGQRVALEAATADVTGFLTGTGRTPTFDDLAEIAGIHGVPVDALTEPALHALGYNEQMAIQYSAETRRAINAAGTLESANALLKDKLGKIFDPNPSDDIYPEFKETTPGSGKWVLTYDGKVLPDAGQFEDAGNVKGWQQMLAGMGEMTSPDGDPIGFYLRTQGLLRDAQPQAAYDMKEYIDLYQSLLSREQPMMTEPDEEGDRRKMTEQEIWDETGRMLSNPGAAARAVGDWPENEDEDEDEDEDEGGAVVAPERTPPLRDTGITVAGNTYEVAPRPYERVYDAAASGLTAYGRVLTTGGADAAARQGDTQRGVLQPAVDRYSNAILRAVQENRPVPNIPIYDRRQLTSAYELGMFAPEIAEIVQQLLAKPAVGLTTPE
jgi:hypothetical protein